MSEGKAEISPSEFSRNNRSNGLSLKTKKSYQRNMYQGKYDENFLSPTKMRKRCISVTIKENQMVAKNFIRVNSKGAGKFMNFNGIICSRNLPEFV